MDKGYSLWKKALLADTAFQHNVPYASLWGNEFKCKGGRKVE